MTSILTPGGTQPDVERVARQPHFRERDQGGAGLRRLFNQAYGLFDSGLKIKERRGGLHDSRLILGMVESQDTPPRLAGRDARNVVEKVSGANMADA